MDGREAWPHPAAPTGGKLRQALVAGGGRTCAPERPIWRHAARRRIIERRITASRPDRDPRAVELRGTVNRAPFDGNQEASVQQNKLFVGNLAFSATQGDVEALFSPYGSLDEVRLVMDRDTGQSRGFAFVTFSAQKDAESALVMNGKPLNGRNMVVNIAKEKPGGRGGRGGGRRGGRRY